VLAAAQITIRDENDVVIASAVPASPVVDMLWLDTSVTPNALKRWNGNAWVDCSEDVDLSAYYTRTEMDTRFAQTDAAIALKADKTTTDSLSTRIAQAEQKITPEAIVGTVTSSSAYGSLSTTVTQTATGLSSVQTKQTEIDGRVQTIEESVIIDGSTITIGKSDVPVQNIINETGFEIKEVGGTVLAYAREGKMGAQRLLLEDALIIGGAALKDMQDGHVLLLKYGG
jgi:hypothetical protein